MLLLPKTVGPFTLLRRLGADGVAERCTMVGIEDWNRADFEAMIRTHPKVLIRFAG